MFEEPSCLVYSVLGTEAGALCSLGKHSVNLQSSFTFSFESFCQIPVKILARITLYCSLFLIKLESCSFTFLSRNIINVEVFGLQFHIDCFSPPGILLKTHVVIFLRFHQSALTQLILNLCHSCSSSFLS